MTAFSINTTLNKLRARGDFNKRGSLATLAAAKPLQTCGMRCANGARRALLSQGLLILLLAFLLTMPALSQAQPAANASQATRSGAETVLVVGDSLSAEYGLKRGSGWVALLENKLQAEKSAVTVVNASISGDTSSGGRARLTALLSQHQPSIVIIELGANDALRGLALDATKQNLLAMTRAAQKAKARVLLVGMQVPPNYGAAYSETFAGLFPQVAKTTQAGLVPFLLTHVADIADPSPLFQRDRIHPNETAHPIMLANVWPELRKLFK
ncbi:MAG: acyl-CoA thioesterase-1 [Polaromonas sp.]|jgi:acyl-CoA thioesterase-1